jgi:short-subunit dehydrogenase
MSLHRNGAALITGASRGIGAAYAERLARRGYDLTLVARNRRRLDVLAARISDETGRGVEVLQADLGEKADLDRIETALKQDASLTMLVNSAGLGPLMRLAYAAALVFAARGHGAIINISSVAAIAPEAFNGVYGGAAAFVLTFSQSLHDEFAGKGVRVQVVLADRVMPVGEMVDAALAGLDFGELVTIPSLPLRTTPVEARRF